MSFVGRSVPRLEDRPLVTGRGRFAADVAFAQMLHMRVVRSAYAHGRIVSIDAGATLALPGVVAVWTFADRVWTRQESAGTALESTATLLVGPRGATGDGDGVLVTGSVLHLDQGVDQTAAAWRSSGVNTGWHRIDLPGAGTHSEAVSARSRFSVMVTGGVLGVRTG